MNSLEARRRKLRPQLFKAKSRNAPHNDLDEKKWLVPNWGIYVQLNFELPNPGTESCLEELRLMVNEKKTPDYKGSQGRGKGRKAKPIPSRSLGLLELAKLRELLEHYQKKWDDMGATGQALSCQINAHTDAINQNTDQDMEKLLQQGQQAQAAITEKVEDCGVQICDHVGNCQDEVKKTVHKRTRECTDAVEKFIQDAADDIKQAVMDQAGYVVHKVTKILVKEDDSMVQADNSAKTALQITELRVKFQRQKIYETANKAAQTYCKKVIKTTLKQVMPQRLPKQTMPPQLSHQ